MVVDTLAARLARARQAVGLSRRGLSLSAGLAQAVAGQIERKEVTEPTPTTMGKLAKILRMPVEWLTYGQLSKSARTEMNRRAHELQVSADWLILGVGDRLVEQRPAA